MENTLQTLEVNGKEYGITKLLGRGKGGYSYLASDGWQECVVKQIHHEPCSYYQFGNKIESEVHDYGRLKKTGIPIPELLAVDVKNERIVKEYIPGPTVYELVSEGRMQEQYLAQVRKMAGQVRQAGLNIDYFPTNFIAAQKGADVILYYIDYECNEYMEEWSFETWGIRYWSKTPEFLAYVEEQQNG